MNRILSSSSVFFYIDWMFNHSLLEKEIRILFMPFNYILRFFFSTFCLIFSYRKQINRENDRMILLEYDRLVQLSKS